jgi:hypothetical protein
MNLLDEVAAAVLEGRGVEARAAWQDLVRGCRVVSGLPPPDASSRTSRALAAGLAELLAARSGQPAPAWAALEPGAEEARFLVTARTEWKREHLRRTTPEPLRRRNFFAPEGFLTFA